MNHGKSNSMVRFCPGCGGRFESQSTARCDERKHDLQRKDRNHYCVDCGKSLKK